MTAAINPYLGNRVMVDKIYDLLPVTIRRQFANMSMLKNTAKLESLIERETDELALLLMAYCIGVKVERSEKFLSVDVPANWWEHLRRDWFPKCKLGQLFLKRKPVLIQKIIGESVPTLTIINMCPHADVPWNGDPYYQRVHLKFIENVQNLSESEVA